MIFKEIVDLLIILCFFGNRYRAMEAELRHERELQDARKHMEDMHSSTSDEGVLLKENSADELDLRNEQLVRRDSEEYVLC